MPTIWAMRICENPDICNELTWLLDDQENEIKLEHEQISDKIKDQLSCLHFFKTE